MVTAIPQQEWQAIVPRRRPAEGDDPGPLARMLYRLRAERPGLTQGMVARDAGIGQSYYSDLENGVVKLPNKDLVASLERAFGVDAGVIEQRLPRRERVLMQEPPSTPYLVGGSMDFQFRGDEIVVRDPSPSVRRIVEHLGALSERAHLALERTLLDLREEEADIDGEEAMREARMDSRSGTKDARA